MTVPGRHTIRNCIMALEADIFLRMKSFPASVSTNFALTADA